MLCQDDFNIIQLIFSDLFCKKVKSTKKHVPLDRTGGKLL